MEWMILVVVFCVGQSTALRFVQISNQNSFPIWIETTTNDNNPPQPKIVKLNPYGTNTYNIQDFGWAGRMWPKTGCDNNGNNCAFGQSIEPCPQGGCQPPAETKVEFFFPPLNDPRDSFYDISLVDGYSLASEITPVQNGNPVNSGACIRTDCHLHLNDCPTDENNGLGDLTVNKNNAKVACLSPCKKWNYPAPYGFGRDEQQDPGRMLCCPKPVTPEDCRRGIVTQTKYVDLVHRDCPSAYSYSYDDEHALHNCPANTSFMVKFYS